MAQGAAPQKKGMGVDGAPLPSGIRAREKAVVGGCIVQNVLSFLVLTSTTSAVCTSCSCPASSSHRPRAPCSSSEELAISVSEYEEAA